MRVQWIYSVKLVDTLWSGSEGFLLKPERDVCEVHEQAWRTSLLIFLAVSGLLSHRGRTASLRTRETLTWQNKSQYSRAALGGKKEEEKRCSCMWLHNTCTGKQFIRVRTRADTKLIHLMERCSAFLSVLPSRSFVLGEQMIVFLCLPSPLVITGNVCVCMMSIYRFQTHKPIVFGWYIFVNCYLLFFHLFFFLFTLFNTFACSLITPTQVPVYLPIIPPTSDPLHRTSSCVRFSSAFIPTEMIDRASVLTSTSRWRYSNNGNGGYVQNWTVMVYFTYTVLYFEVEESKWKHVKLAI